jgi:hypothetical protein
VHAAELAGATAARAESILSVDAFAAGSLAAFGIVNAVAIMVSATMLATALEVSDDASLAAPGGAAATVQLLYVLSGHLWGVGGTFFGLWLIHLDVQVRGAAFLVEPWMVAKLIGVVLLLAWHLYLVAERRKILAGTSVRTSKFWRMTNEVPFVLAIVMVLSVTMEWTF